MAPVAADSHANAGGRRRSVAGVPFRSVALHRWADHVGDDHVERVAAALDELAATTPAIRSLTHGADTGVHDDTYDYAIVIDVATAADWRTVRNHPPYVLLVEELLTGHVVDRAVAQFRIDDPAAMSPDTAHLAELSDEELMAQARRAAQASMDALMAEPDEI